MAMPKPSFVPTRQQKIDVFHNSMLYEILFTFGVPIHDPTDYCNWEAVNFTRIAHARLLYDFFEHPATDRHKDDVLAEDFGFPAAQIPLPPDDRHRLNKDLMHFTYDRLRHTPATKPWPDSIIGCLHDPTLHFMRHVGTQADLFGDPVLARFWHELIACMESGRQLIIQCKLGPDNRLAYKLNQGCALPSGKGALTRFGQPY